MPDDFCAPFTPRGSGVRISRRLPRLRRLAFLPKFSRRQNAPVKNRAGTGTVASGLVFRRIGKTRRQDHENWADTVDSCTGSFKRRSARRDGRAAAGRSFHVQRGCGAERGHARFLDYAGERDRRRRGEPIREQPHQHFAERVDAVSKRWDNWKRKRAAVKPSGSADRKRVSSMTCGMR